MEFSSGILTVSDRCSRGEAEDTSGPNLLRLLTQSQSLNVKRDHVITKCVPDMREEIERVLLHWSDQLSLRLILTTGGTGFSPRDVTPEVTRLLIEKEAPGLAIAMISKSLSVTPMAMLSRAVCGIRGSSLIVNLPGSKKGAQECLEFLMPALPHALDLLSNNTEKVSSTHHTMHHHHHPHHPHSHHCHHHERKGGRSREDFTPVSQRARHSPYPMIAVDKALNTVLKYASRRPVLTVDITAGDVVGQVLAENICAQQPVPPFPASIKDGYAVIAADSTGDRKVMSTVAAGEMSSVSVKSGCVCRITTGAALPAGADAVVQVEDTELVEATPDGEEELVVRILTAVSEGCDVRPVGSDIPESEVVLREGDRLGPAELGLLATVGVSRVKVFSQPRVSVLSTGNEVVNTGEKLRPGQIYDSNRATLLAAVREHGLTPVDLGIVSDSQEALTSAIAKALRDSDVLVTTGGVSMGEKDLLKPVLEEEFNATVHFGRVFMKPGKPTTFATIDHHGDSKLVFSLPGNPVSATVTFYLFVLPALRQMMGLPSPHLTTVPCKLLSTVNLDPRPEYHRVKVEWHADDTTPTATSTGGQRSSRLLSMRGANALLVLPPRTDQLTELEAGSLVKAMLIGDL